MRPLEFWFEFASTYSYPAAMRIEEAAAAASVPLVWKPFLLGPVFGQQGWNDSPFNIYPAKGRYMWRDLERICTGLDVPLVRPSRFPRNGLMAARVALVGAAEPWGPAFVRAVYRANFAEDRDIASPDVLATVLDGVGQDAVAMLERVQAPEVKDALRHQTEQAMALGIFGAPTFVSGAELFWGNDRLEDALAWHRERQGLPTEG
ncbi:MAG TPA: 2-hydroxychromene-2-carboxylate isomerase [Candidatus Binatia bacterium]|jgi:2-hydroxychromene-2-carboxylate isomerase|nr:2-hydroxychromene-2-carboxylate isomerase [Candidatus Binatia bacterium]